MGYSVGWLQEELSEALQGCGMQGVLCQKLAALPGAEQGKKSSKAQISLKWWHSSEYRINVLQQCFSSMFKTVRKRMEKLDYIFQLYPSSEGVTWNNPAAL